MAVPDYITHYYYPDKKPFLNLSDLNEEERAKIIEELNQRKDDNETQRGFPDWYMPQRLDSEKEMLNILTRKGIIPERKNPHYFVLGSSPFFEKHYNFNFKKIEIPIKEFREGELTFTPSDSLWCIGKIMRPDTNMKSMPFDQDLFNYNEVSEIIKSYNTDILDTQSMLKIRSKFVEAQVWSNRVIEKY